MSGTTRTVVDCTVVELEPAVRDSAGNVLRPPVLREPEVTTVDLDAGELAAWQADQDADAQARATAEQQQVAAAWVALRMKRDRWLAQTDAFFVSPMPEEFPADKAQQIADSKQAWASFRQQLRDLPANTADPRTPDWPTPPAAPTVYLT